MARSNSRNKPSIWFSHGCIFFGGVLAAVFVVWGFWSFIAPFPTKNPNFHSVTTELKSLTGPDGALSCSSCAHGPDLRHDEPEKTFYDDPEMGYALDKPMKNWDEKRRQWLLRHQSFIPGARNRILMVTGSQPFPCQNPIGDHLLLWFFKNKVDYCRLHGYNIFYNNVLLHPKMELYWSKYPMIKAAMMAHPEAEWIWWIDSDAMFTNMDFKLPLHRYKNHNLMIQGWPRLIREEKRSMGLNAGVFLIRNCQWSLDFMKEWANMGPQSPDYEKWGEIQRKIFKDKSFPESDDQAGLAYLILEEREKWGNKIYLETEYAFSGYWANLIGTYENITEGYIEVEREEKRLRRRHAEMVSESYSEMREKYVKKKKKEESWRRPFITHFTGCQPCNGNHNKKYSGDACWNGMKKALNFADNQVLRNYGYIHQDLLDNSVSAIPFDYPA